MYRIAFATWSTELVFEKGVEQRILPSQVILVVGEVLDLEEMMKPAVKRRWQVKWKTKTRKWGSSCARRTSSTYCQNKRPMKSWRGSSTWRTWSCARMGLQDQPKGRQRQANTWERDANKKAPCTCGGRRMDQKQFWRSTFMKYRGRGELRN